MPFPALARVLTSRIGLSRKCKLETVLISYYLGIESIAGKRKPMKVFMRIYLLDL